MARLAAAKRLYEDARPAWHRALDLENDGRPLLLFGEEQPLGRRKSEAEVINSLMDVVRVPTGHVPRQVNERSWRTADEWIESLTLSDLYDPPPVAIGRRAW